MHSGEKSTRTVYAGDARPPAIKALGSSKNFPVRLDPGPAFDSIWTTFLSAKFEETLLVDQ